MSEETLFTDALEIADPAERVAFLDRACSGNPELRARLDKLLAEHAQAGSFLGRPADLPLTGTLAYAADRSTFDAATASGGGQVIGPYKLVEVIGEGGMGTVWLAQQQQPVKRLVALKVIKPGMDSRQVLARFEAERQALALMDHPNIAKVLDAGAIGESSRHTPSAVSEDGTRSVPATLGRPFFAMELVKGVPITKFCDERKLTPRERLELFVPVCQAVQHAHQKGVIHRDIKPSNVLVALYDGRPVPKVIDFGVAKAAGQPLTEKTLITGLGVVVGTPEYMSPEQAELNQLDIDTRSDIYSLGVLLYELLTGTTPLLRKRVKEAALLEVLRLVREEEPPRPSTRLSTTDELPSIAANRGVEPRKLSGLMRGELDWIVMKALDKDRSRRYETANGFAVDVLRYLGGEAVQAVPPSAGYRLRKFVRRHRGRVVAGSLILLALVGGLIGTTYGVIEAGNQRLANTLRAQAERDRDEAKSARGEAETARAAAESARDGEKAARAEVFREKEKLAAVEYGRTMQVVLQEWQDNNLLAARRLLDDSRKDLRGWEWQYLHRLCHADLLTLQGHGSWVKSAVFSPDGSRVLTASQDKTARIWDARTGTELFVLEGHAFPVTRHGTRDDLTAAFSPDGSLVVTASADNSARVWDVRSGKEVAGFKGHTSWLTSVAFSPDGERVVTSSLDGTARVWNARTGTERWVLKGHTSLLLSAVFSPDGERVVTAGQDGTARVWNAKTGIQQHALKEHTEGVMSAVFSPDGSLIVTASVDNTARVWDAKTGTALHAFRGHTSHVHSAAFSPDGTRVVTSSQDGTARVWNARTGAEQLAIKGHTRLVNSAVFSPDGERIATASYDTTARLWDATTGAPLQVFKGHTTWVNFAVFNHDGTRLVTASDDGTARVWDATTRAELPALRRRDSHNLVSGAFTPSGPRVVTQDSAGTTAKVWNAMTGAVVFALNGHTDHVAAAAFSPDGSWIVTGSADSTARVWDASSGAERHALMGHTGFVRTVAFSRDGSRVVTGSADTTARVWDASTGIGRCILKGHTSIVRSVAFSPDGTRVVTTSNDRTARVWDASTGVQLLALDKHAHWVLTAAFSPDGKRLVTGSFNTAKVWDANTGAELLTLKGNTYGILTASFSPDGTRIVTGGNDGAARVWDASTGAEFLTLKGHVPNLGVPTAVFSPDGMRILTVGPDSTTKPGIIATAIILDSRPVNRAYLHREVVPPPGNTK